MRNKLFLAVFGVFYGLSVLANPVAILEDNGDHYTQTENGYIVNFDLKASSDEYISVMNKAEDNARLFTLTAVEDGVNNYDCILTINHQNHPEYVHKMMLTLGITTLIYKDTTHPIAYIVDILKSYQ